MTDHKSLATPDPSRPVQARKQADLVFDVGLHKGEDTCFYLLKGFRVVAFEANPLLVAHCRERFADALAEERLTIVEGAILDPADARKTDGTVRFFRNRDKSVWGTVLPDWARRNEALGTSNETIEVPVVDFGDCLQRYGVPHYLKIDIEGMDTVCLRSLAGIEPKPDYLSIESDKVDFDRLAAEIELLQQLGYTGFQAVQQVGVARQKEPQPAREGRYTGHRFHDGCSGLFGADLPDDWSDREQILERYRRIFTGYRYFGDDGLFTRHLPGRVLFKIARRLTGKPLPGWYDTHARLKSP